MACIRILFVIICVCFRMTAALEYTIAEEEDPGTFIANIATDADLLGKYGIEVIQTLEFSFLTPQGDNPAMVIEKNGGIIRTGRKIDREESCPPPMERCELTVDVAITPAQYFQIVNVKVTIIDVNDNAPYFGKTKIVTKISELSLPGVKINLPMAQDPDMGVNGVQGYQLDSSTDKFELEVTDLPNGLKSVQIVLMGRLDREQVDLYTVTLAAFDGGSPRRSGSVLVDIMVEDGNDHSPYFENTTYVMNVAENTPVNTTVIRIVAKDADIGDFGHITYSINAGTDTQIEKIFGIDTKTGEIYFKESPDFESQSTYTLLVEAEDGGPNSQPAHATVVINIKDLNDNAPQITVNALTPSGGAQISESSPVGTFVAHVSVTDSDGDQNGKFSCALDNDLFVLEKLQDTQYKIVTEAVFDRETRAQHYVKITCEDHGEPPHVENVMMTVEVVDENDNIPVFTQTIYSVTIQENNRIDAIIAKVNATDADSGRNADITYRLQDDGATIQLVHVHEKTGVVRANVMYDFETLKEFQFTVIAFDNGTPTRSASSAIYVTIMDTNDNAPFFSQPLYTFDVMENQPIGMEIGLVAASDADSEPFNKFEFSFLPSKEALLFAVDTRTGHIRTKATLDREYQKVFQLTVIATNINVNHILSSSAVITINVQDENDNAPSVEFPNQQNHTIHISNMVPVGYEIGVIQARDVDDGENAKLAYSFTRNRDNNAFHIAPDTGMITTRDSLAGLDTKLFEMQVLVSDNGIPPKTATATLYIVVDKSIIYPGSKPPGRLLGGTNLTIVIALSVTSVIVVVILIIAIVFTKMQDRKHTNPGNPAYKYRIAGFNFFRRTSKNHTQNQTQQKNINQENGTNQAKEAMKSRQLGNKKEVSFSLQNEAIKNKLTKSGESNKKAVNGSRPSGTSRQSWPGSAAVSKDPSMRPSYMGEGVSSVSGGAYSKTQSVELPPQTLPSQHPDPATQKLWELNVKQLQCQQWFDSLKPDQDTDSSSAGEASNTDSGRGPSEEGEHSLGSLAPVVGAHGMSGANQPRGISTGGNHGNKSPTKKGSLQNPGQHPQSRSEVPVKMKDSPYRDLYRNIPQHQQPLDQSRPIIHSHGYNGKGRFEQTPSHLALSNAGCLGGCPSNTRTCGPLVDNLSHGEPWYSAASNDTFADEGSSTSGSYIVDCKDLEDVPDPHSYKSVVV